MATSQMSTDELLALIERSALLGVDRLAPYQDRIRNGEAGLANPEGLARQLVRDRLLTPFQAKQLLRGRYRGFFLSEKYKVLELLGEGGMGRVLLCEHLILHKLVAVKLLQISGGAMQGANERFLREARAAAALDHPNIVRVFDVDKAGQVPFMVMDYVDGTNLHQVVAEHGPLAVRRAAEYGRQAALGLQHAHEMGLVHRDMKPGNLLLDRNGTVKLLDLGLARFFDAAKNQNLTQKFDEKSVLGTADFIAPEQAMNSSRVDIRADVYSLGCTLYFLLTRRFPFDEGSVTQKLMWHQTREPEPVDKIRPDLPAGLTDAIKRMMKKDPADRFQTPAEAAAALAPFAVGHPEPPPPEEMPRVRPTMYLIGLCPPPSQSVLMGESATATPNMSSPQHPTATGKGSRPDGNFGTGPNPALTATPRPMPPTGMPATGYPPAGYPPAGYPPSAGYPPPEGYDYGPMTGYAPPRPRTPLTLILAGVAGLVMAVAGGLAVLYFMSLSPPTPVTRSDRGGNGPEVPPEKRPPSSDAPEVPLTGVVLNGAGSSFVDPLMQEWANQYVRKTGDQIKYQALGSGRGISGVTEKLLDFGCSDAPMKNDELSKARDINGDIVHIPLAMGAVVPTYNLPETTERLKFTGPLLAQIFMGKVTTWDDEAIIALNPSAGIPKGVPIKVVHRKDKSGTTFIWTEYLSKVYGPFKDAVGTGTVGKWPGGQLEGEQNNGVAEQVNRNPGAIGYVELSYAVTNALSYGVIKNRAGRYPSPDFDSVTAAADASLQEGIPDDLRYSLTDAPGANSYPACGTVWAMVYRSPPRGNGRHIGEFLWWAVHDGQVSCKPLKYAPLPPALVRRCEEKIRSINGAGESGR